MIVEEKKALDKNCCRDWKQPCCGSLCMAWRWEPLREEQKKEGDAIVKHTYVSSTHGYCGLAGRP